MPKLSVIKVKQERSNNTRTSPNLLQYKGCTRWHISLKFAGQLKGNMHNQIGGRWYMKYIQGYDQHYHVTKEIHGNTILLPTYKVARWHMYQSRTGGGIHEDNAYFYHSSHKIIPLAASCRKIYKGWCWCLLCFTSVPFLSRNFSTSAAISFVVLFSLLPYSSLVVFVNYNVLLCPHYRKRKNGKTAGVK